MAISVFSFGQKNYSFSISEVGLPEGDRAYYKCNNKVLIVYKNSEKIAKIIFSNDQRVKLDSIISNLSIENFQDQYHRSIFILDGVNWTFTFKKNKLKKEIFLDNYYFEPLDELVRNINFFLPEKSQILSFGEDMHLRSDTVIYYLPDFYVDNVLLPDTNYSFSAIMCFRKGYFVTEILDSISLCDCRIYPKDKNNSSYTKKPLWRAWRQENNSWKRDYYDKNDNIFKTDYVKDILPYQIVKEKIYNDIGAKPSVIIHRYYKTETLQKKE